MRKIIKNILLSITTTGTVVAPVAAVVSCSDKVKTDYDFGVAMSPFNTLNYLKYNSIAKIQPMLIHGLFNGGPPSGELKNQLQLPDFKFSQYEITLDGSIVEKDGYVIGKEGIEVDETGSGIYTMSDYGEYSGTASTLGYVDYDTGASKAILVGLDPAIKWKVYDQSLTKFERSVESQDYIDYLKYVVDLNSASEFTTIIGDYNITGFNDLVEAQREYSRQKFNDESGETDFGLYSSPFGIFDETVHAEAIVGKYLPETTDPKEQEYLDNIKDAAIKFLTEGAVKINDPIGDHAPTRTVVNIDGEEEEEYFTNFMLQFDEHATATSLSVYSQLLRYINPAHSDFIEHVGGIHSFGASPDKFIYISPFDLADVRLGSGGYIDFEKDNSFPTADYTISNKIKVYFQDDPNILAAMFNDGYISATQVQNLYQPYFWADSSLRKFMQKTNGFGTVGIQLNIDESTNGDSPLQYESFRNALSHAIDRERILKLAGWDTSVPVTTWTVAGQAKTSDGRYIDTYLDGQTFKTEFSDKDFSLTNLSWLTHSGKQYNFENIDRTDIRFDVEIANEYLDKYRDESGDTGKIVLSAVTDSTNVNSFIGVQTILKDAFNGQVDLDIRVVPTNSFNIERISGNFDMVNYNFDQYGQSPHSYVSRFFVEDSVQPGINKTSGFVENPSGGWTFNKWYQNLTQEEIAKVKEQLNVTDWVWNKFAELASQDVNSEEFKTALSKVWQSSETIESTNIYNSDRLFEFIILLEKIIAITTPVISLYEVDVNWNISRLAGVSSLYSFNLQYAYDVYNKPRPNLPGEEEVLS